MYPDLSYLLHAVFGTAPDNGFAVIKTFGLLLAICFLVAGYIVHLELLRKEAQGLVPHTLEKSIIGLPVQPLDLAMSGLLGFLTGFKLLFAAQNFEAFKQDAVGIIFSSAGSWLGGIIGATILVAHKYWQVNREKLETPIERESIVKASDRVGDFVMVAAVSGIIGAKVFAILEDLDQFWADPFGTFFSGSGLAIYGGLIGGFIGVFLYIRKYKIPALHIMDAVAPALILGYAIGRIGCQLSGDGDWGIVNEAVKPDFIPQWLWASDYPHNVNKEGIPIEGCTWQYCNKLEKPVYPAPIYETIMGVVIFSILWFLRKRIHIAGTIFFIYMILNGLERFAIEKIRVNTRYAEFFNMTQAEIIAICFILIGIIGCVWLWQRNKGNPSTA